MRQIGIFCILLLAGYCISSCCSTKKAENTGLAERNSVPGPKVVIYQTTNDYFQFVPVILTDDKKSIESYPGIKDVFYNGNLAYPTRLHNGYLLDNRGIGKNVAFLKFTYEEYSKLPETPSTQELMKMIMDDQPLVSMYVCGDRSSYKNIETELNSRIDNNDFLTFTKIK